MNIIPNFPIYVRFSETNASGYVSTISYFLYLEEARTRLFEILHLDKYKEHLKMNVLVASTECRFLKQVYAKQRLILTTKVIKIGTKSFTLQHEIKSQNGDVLAVGSAVIVCYCFQTQKSIKIPHELRQSLEAYLQTN